MATNFVQDGRMLDYTNSTSAVITSGRVLAVGAVLGVAMDDIAVGASGEIAIEGVFIVPKVSAAEIRQGETLTWDVSVAAFNNSAATAATGDITGPTAFAAESAGDGVTSLAVKFTGVPGTVKV
ncbi:capsid cement protein [Microbulbifer variabilis]|uniref:capsid cement protein n=1 Tax=Microbulbifer variabilis TaxID=266805 RepID=UPI00036A246B|nr:capsid cement protein [Microbulbifer variabilis]